MLHNFDADTSSFGNKLAHQLQMNAALNETDTLSNADCISAYAQSYQFARGNVAVVLDLDHVSYDVLHDGQLDYVLSYGVIDMKPYPVIKPMSSNGGDSESADPYPWICYGPREPLAPVPCQLNISSIRAEPSAWHIPVMLDPGDMGMHLVNVSHCLSERIEQHCKLKISVGLFVALTGFIFMMAAMLCFVALSVKETPLLTTGDAICSFLEQRDSYTRDMCLVSGSSVREMRKRRMAHPQIYTGKRKRWLSSPGRTSWHQFCFS
jgi:hypothetical protein